MERGNEDSLWRLALSSMPVRTTAMSAFAEVFDLLPCMGFVERDGRILAWNASARRITELAAPGAAGLAVEDVFHGPYERGRGDQRVRFEGLLMRRHGRPLHVSCAVQSVQLLGIPCRLILAMEREEGLAGLVEGEGSFLEDLLDATPEATVITHSGRILHVNREFVRLFGYPLLECLGDDLDELVTPTGLYHENEMIEHTVRTEGRAMIETTRRTRGGEEIAVSVVVAPVRLGSEARGLFVTYRDIRELKKEEARLKFTALHDGLTGLANRALFLDRLQLTMARLQRRPDRNFATFFIDLDGFKQVNDTLGHAAGDALLLVVADRLKESLRPQDTVARLGGDEFALLLDDAGGLDEISTVAERIQEQIGQPIFLDDREVQVSASIGVAVGTPMYVSGEEVMRDADYAMYEAKVAGKARHMIFGARKKKV